jgi:hypothetical protein
VRARPIALRVPGLRPGVPGALLLFAAAAAWAQIPDLRNPALYREPPRAATCRVCGEITSIREVRGDAPVPGQAGAEGGAGKGADWAVVGAVVLVPIGPGPKAEPYVGGVGTPEMAERFGAGTYEIAVRMDGGERQVVRNRDGARFRVGDRVTVSGGLIAPL